MRADLLERYRSLALPTTACTLLVEVTMFLLALAPYAAFGVVPLVIPPIIPTVKVPTSGFESQLDTDLA